MLVKIAFVTLFMMLLRGLRHCVSVNRGCCGGWKRCLASPARAFVFSLIVVVVADVFTPPSGAMLGLHPLLFEQIKAFHLTGLFSVALTDVA